MVYSLEVVEVVSPPVCLVPLLFLILFETLAGRSRIGGVGWPGLEVFAVEPGLANSWRTL